MTRFAMISGTAAVPQQCSAVDTAMFPTVIGKRRCGACGEPGHYQQTCQKRQQGQQLPLDAERDRLRKAYLDNKNAVISAAKEWKLLHPDRARETRERFWTKHGDRVKQQRKHKRKNAYLHNPKETWLLEVFRAARVRSRKADIPFDNQVPDLALPDVCPVLGVAISYRAKLGKHSPSSPSLDRIDPLRGYVASNLRVISNRANMLKSNASLEEMRLVLADMERIVQCAG